MEYKAGDKVWVHLPWVDEDCWVEGTVIKETAKRVKVETQIRPNAYFAKHNVKAAS